MLTRRRCRRLLSAQVDRPDGSEAGCNKSYTAGCALSQVETHRDSRSQSVITDISLVIAEGLKTRRQSFDDVKAEPCVERRVPWHVSEGGQGHRWETILLRPIADAFDQGTPEALSTFRREYRELPDMGETVDNLDASEANRWRPRDQHDGGLS